MLTAKTIAACRAHGVDTLVVGGGFSANSQLRDMAAKRCAEAGIELRIPPIRYCTDNGAMIAALGSAVRAPRAAAVVARPARRLLDAAHPGAGLRTFCPVVPGRSGVP